MGQVKRGSILTSGVACTMNRGRPTGGAGQVKAPPTPRGGGQAGRYIYTPTADKHKQEGERGQDLPTAFRHPPERRERPDRPTQREEDEGRGEREKQDKHVKHAVDDHGDGDRDRDGTTGRDRDGPPPPPPGGFGNAALIPDGR